jgi:DNA-binding response OmpR family regulator
VLLLESEPSLRKVVAASLKQTGLRIIEAEDADSARMRLEEESPDLFVLELDHPAGEHGALIDAFRQQCDEGAVVLTTTERPREGWRHRYQPEAIVYKPYDVRLLSRRIRRLIQRDERTEDSASGGATDDPNDR